MVARLAGICIYPIKSAGALTVDAARIGTHGFELDRRWMLVDADGTFLSQRKLPRMALLRPEVDGDVLRVRAPGREALDLPLRAARGSAVRVRIWGDACDALAPSRAADAWFSAFLGVACRAVYLPDASLRRVDPGYAQVGDRVGLADGFPFLLASEASLAELGARAGMELAMSRFRPNLVVAGTEPFAEDGWRRIRVGAVGFRVAKPCARCVVTTVDQETAQVGKEPLRTLATFRRAGSKVLFGQNLIHDGRGTLRVDDPVTVEEPAPDPA